MNKKIIKIKKDDEGDITDVMLDNGDIFALNHVIDMAREGAIEGVKVGKGKHGAEYLIADTNSINSEDLGSLPTF